jgi:hypothetical protein
MMCSLSELLKDRTMMVAAVESAADCAPVEGRNLVVTSALAC